MEDVRLSLAKDNLRPVLVEQVQRLGLDAVRFPLVEGVAARLVTTNVGSVKLRNTDFGSGGK